MKKIYILTINDIRNTGYNCKDVEVFTEKKNATARMRELYLKAYKDVFGDEGDPYEQDSMDYQYTKDFAFVFGEYYLDIFEKEV